MKRTTSQNNKNELIVFKTIFKTFLKTLLVIITSLSFFLVSFSVVSPRTILPFFNAFKLKDAKYLVYERIYKRNPTNENLYNVIQLSIEEERYEDQVYYISIMISDDDYQKFCESVDNKTEELYGEFYVVKAGSYNDYLMSNLIVALYKTNKSLDAKFRAIDSVYGNCVELVSYIDMVKNDQQMIYAQIESEFNTLYSRYGLLEGLNARLDELDEMILSTDSNLVLAKCYKSKIDISYILYNLAHYSSDSVNENNFKQNLESWTIEYNKIISNA